jgi:TolB protein
MLAAGLLALVGLLGIPRASAHGSLLRLTTDARDDVMAAYSPSGQKIAFLRSDPETNTVRLWVMNSGGGGERELTTTGFVAAGGGDLPQWSPDGKRLYFWKYNTESGVFEVSLRTGVIRRVADSGSQLALSPDGKQLAFVGDSGYFQILVIPAGGGAAATSLTPQLPYAVQPPWSPDGTQIAFVATRDDSGRSFIFVMDADGGNVRDLTAAYPDLQGQFPVWSPDGDKIAFTGIFPTAEGEEIDSFVMDADGTDLVDVSNVIGTEDVKVWSPDGEMLAFDSFGRAESEGLYTVRPDGTGRIFIARGFQPTWARYGKRLAFFGALDGQDAFDIYSVTMPNH